MKDKIFEMILNDDKKYYTNKRVKQILRVQRNNVRLIKKYIDNQLRIIPGVTIIELEERIDDYEEMIHLLNDFDNGKTIKEFYENEKKKYLQDVLGCIEELKINIVNAILKEYLLPFKSEQ